jgi:hypothetical protein
MQLKIKLAALAMAGGTAALVLAGTPALAGSHAGIHAAILAGSKAVTAPESAFGVISGQAATANNPTIPLAWRGQVYAHGGFSPDSGGPPAKGQDHTFTTSAGNLTVVVTAPPASSGSVNPKTCHFAFTTDVVFAAVGSQSTGKFTGTSGPGAVEVYNAGFVPRYTSGPHNGQCNTSNNAPELAKGAIETFLLSAVLTTP